MSSFMLKKNRKRTTCVTKTACVSQSVCRQREEKEPAVSHASNTQDQRARSTRGGGESRSVEGIEEISAEPDARAHGMTDVK